MNFFERIQVLSSLAGGHKWEQVLETGGMQAVPILEKRQRESAVQVSSPEGLTPFPRGVGAGLGVALPDAGMVLVCLSQRGNWSNSRAPPRALHLAS